MAEPAACEAEIACKEAVSSGLFLKHRNRLYRFAGFRMWPFIYFPLVAYVVFLGSGWDGDVLHIGSFAGYFFGAIGVVVLVKEQRALTAPFRRLALKGVGEITWFVRVSDEGVTLGIRGIEEVQYSWFQVDRVQVEGGRVRFEIGGRILNVYSSGQDSGGFDEFKRCAAELGKTSTP